MPATSLPAMSLLLESRNGRLVRLVAIYLVAPLLMLVAVPAAIYTIARPDPGFSLRNLTVAAVYPGGPAERAGIAKGDEVTAIDERSRGPHRRLLPRDLRTTPASRPCP